MPVDRVKSLNTDFKTKDDELRSLLHFKFNFPRRHRHHHRQHRIITHFQQP